MKNGQNVKIFVSLRVRTNLLIINASTLPQRFQLFIILINVQEELIMYNETFDMIEEQAANYREFKKSWLTSSI